MAKKRKGKSILDTAREMEQQAARDEQKARELAQQAEAEQRRAYEEKLREERLELLRLKQGVIEESETIHEEREEEKKYTFFQKIGNFFYHNKWWMGFAAFFVLLIGFLTWHTITQERPDMIVLLLADNDSFEAMSSKHIAELFEQYIEDENGDGRVIVHVYYIPASTAKLAQNSYSGSSTKLFSEFQSGEAVLVIADSEADTYISAEQNLMDLEPRLGQYAQTDGYRFLLSGTDFAQTVDWDDALDEDFYIGIRIPKKTTMDSYEKMQKVFDISYPALEQFAAQFGTPAEDEAEAAE